MTIDEAIKHCLEVAEENEELSSKFDEWDEWEEADANNCRECAADHRQLAEWLTELDILRHRVLGDDPLIDETISMLDSELKEAKRLLKAAVEDFAKMDYHIYDCDRECDACPLSGERDHCLKWRYADEALKLIGGSENE